MPHPTVLVSGNDQQSFYNTFDFMFFLATQPRVKFNILFNPLISFLTHLIIKKYGERLYDNIVVLAPSVTAFGNGITAADFLQFVDDGGNLLVTGSSEIGDPIKEIAADCGIEFDDEGTSVIDHMNYDVSDAGQHTTIVADQFSPTTIISGESPSPVLFSGIGMAADPENPLVVDILHAASTAYR